MTDKLRLAAEMALKALGHGVMELNLRGAARSCMPLHEAIAAIKEALAESEVNTETHDLLSTMVGLFLGLKDKIGYKPNSVADKVVNEAVEHLKDWPYSGPTPQQAETAAAQEPDPADIIAGALQTSRGYAIDLMREALKESVEVQEPVSGVVIREGLPTLLQDRHIKSTDERLYTHHAPTADEQTVINGIVSAAGTALEVLQKHRQMKGDWPVGELGRRAYEELDAAVNAAITAKP